MRTIQGTFIRFTSLALLAATGTVAGMADAQTMSSSSSGLSLPNCTISTSKTNQGLPDPGLFPMLPAACEAVLADHMKKKSDADPSKVQPMYRVDPATWPQNLASTTPADMRKGLIDAFLEGNTKVLDNHGVSYASVMQVFSTAPLIQTKTIAQAINHRAHMDWDQRGKSIADANNPCGEWVWKGFYDYSRFEDAAAACGTNDECVYRVAYSSTTKAPGIASRTYLTGLDDGKYFASQYRIPLITGYVSKNPFFGAASSFLSDQQNGLLEDMEHFEMSRNAAAPGSKVEMQAGPKSYSCAPTFRFRDPQSKYYVDPSNTVAVANLNQKIGAVRALLQKNAGYLINPTGVDMFNHPNTERFATEWDYHKAMHDRQKPLSGVKGQPLPEAERRAVDERTKTLLDLVERYAILTSAVAHSTRNLNVIIGERDPVSESLDRIISPRPDEVVVDPMVRRLAISSMDRDLVDPASIPLLQQQGNVVTNQMVVPFRLDTTAPLGSAPAATTPMSGSTAGTTLVGAETNYGQAAVVEPAAVGVSSSCPTPPEETDKTADMYKRARLAQEVQEQIVALLLDEYDRGADGCLSENGYNCDWSPTLFAQRFKGHFADAREKAFQQCVLLTGGNRLDSPDPLFSVPANKRTMAGFPDHLATVEAILKEQLDGLPHVVRGKDHLVGEQVTGGKEIGHSGWFRASYSYSAGWSLVPQFKANPDGSTDATATPCAFSGDAGASFNAHVTILNKEFTLANVSGNGKASPVKSEQTVHVEFLNETFLDGAKAERFHLVHADTKETSRATATVVVVVVPVRFEAFGELEFGYDVEASMTSNNVCGGQGGVPSFGVRLGVQPFAKVNAVASAAVGVGGAQAGVRGRIALLDAKLPLVTSLEVKPDPVVPSTIKLFPNASANLEVGTLSGRMSAFAEVDYYLGSYTAEKNIFSWGGLRDTVPLLQVKSDPVYLAAFKHANWRAWVDVNGSHAAAGSP